VAVADAMCIVRFVSILPIDQVMVWSPSEHTACPDTNGRCAHAGIAVAATKTPANVATPTASSPRRRTDRPNRQLAGVLTVAPQGMNRPHVAEQAGT
jgi:hypothetical protein